MLSNTTAGLRNPLSGDPEASPISMRLLPACSADAGMSTSYSVLLPRVVPRVMPRVLGWLGAAGTGPFQRAFTLICGRALTWANGTKMRRR